MTEPQIHEAANDSLIYVNREYGPGTATLLSTLVLGFECEFKFRIGYVEVTQLLGPADLVSRDTVIYALSENLLTFIKDNTDAPIWEGDEPINF